MIQIQLFYYNYTRSLYKMPLNLYLFKLKINKHAYRFYFKKFKRIITPLYMFDSNNN